MRMHARAVQRCIHMCACHTHCDSAVTHGIINTHHGHTSNNNDTHLANKAVLIGCKFFVHSFLDCFCLHTHAYTCANNLRWERFWLYVCRELIKTSKFTCACVHACVSWSAYLCVFVRFSLSICVCVCVCVFACVCVCLCGCVYTYVCGSVSACVHGSIVFERIELSAYFLRSNKSNIIQSKCVCACACESLRKSEGQRVFRFVCARACACCAHVFWIVCLCVPYTHQETVLPRHSQQGHTFQQISRQKKQWLRLLLFASPLSCPCAASTCVSRPDKCNVKHRSHSHWHAQQNAGRCHCSKPDHNTA